jgi:hypothetical protein
MDEAILLPVAKKITQDAAKKIFEKLLISISKCAKI